MNHEKLRASLLAFPGAEESLPFGPDVWVYKVGGKIFALLTPPESGFRLSLKCDPQRAQLLRSEFAAIVPGYHLNKEHWNTLDLERDLPPQLIQELSEHSYDLVFASLSKRFRKQLNPSLG